MTPCPTETVAEIVADDKKAYRKSDMLFWLEMKIGNRYTCQNSTIFLNLVWYTDEKAEGGVVTVRFHKVQKAIRKIPALKITGVAMLFLSGAGRVFGCVAPFGAACAAVLLFRNVNIYMLLLPVVGAVLSTGDAAMLKYILAILLMTAVSAKASTFSSENRSRVVCAICVWIANVVYISFLGIDLKTVGVAGAETILAFLAVHPYRVVLDMIYQPEKVKASAKDKGMCAVFVCMACLCGIVVLDVPFGTSILKISMYFGVLFCANGFSFGVCAIFGILAGLMPALSRHIDVLTAGGMCLCALVCRCFKSYGKTGIAVGLVFTNAVLLLNGAVEIDFFEIGVASVLFLCLPEKYLQKTKQRLTDFMCEKEETEERDVFREMAVKRLGRIAEAFSELAASMGKKGAQRKEAEKEVALMLSDDVYQRVCGKCEEKEKCRLYAHKIHTIIENVLKKTVARGRAELYDLSAETGACIRKEKLIGECNKMYELYRVNKVWENRINENRMLVSRQLEDVSDVVRNLADEMTENACFEKNAEQKLATLLTGLGIASERIHVLRDIHNRLHIELSVSDCKQKLVCERELKTALRKVFDRDFTLKKGKCNKERCKLTYREQENFSVQIGISRIRPQKEDIFGDSYAIMYPEDGKVIVALSDGMGTGARAAKESRETVGLLEKLVMAGVDRETAVKLINSVLVLRSFEDGYATLDLLLLDLYGGEGSLIKNASANTYVCRENRVGVMASRALPPGVIGEVETSGRKFLLKDGDVVLLLSDGVTEADANDDWIKAFLLEDTQNDAQQCADKLMEEAKRKVRYCTDDMTVILIKISEK